MEYNNLKIDEDDEESYNSTYFSTTEERCIKHHDLKVKAFEALHDGSGNGYPSNSASNPNTVKR